MSSATDLSAILLAVGCHVTVAKAGGKYNRCDSASRGHCIVYYFSI